MPFAIFIVIIHRTIIAYRIIMVQIEYLINKIESYYYPLLKKKRHLYQVNY